MVNILREQAQETNGAADTGAAVYSKPVLAVYDQFVLGFSNTFAWRCPSRQILDFYDQNISGKHLDVGVGTGYFLDRCRFPTPNPILVLMDLNPNSLGAAGKRLQRYKPTRHVANVLEALHIEPTNFDSIGLNYLLHCLPGNLLTKEAAIRHLKPLLNPDGGVMFGTTILGKGVEQNILARTLMRIYNSRGIFSNMDDTVADLDSVLKDTFREYTIRVVGCAAFFTGRI